jgi:uncharacterized protein (TIGR03437 family)
MPNLGPDFVLPLDPTGSQLWPPLHFPHGAITAPPALDTAGRVMLLGAQGSLLTVPANYNFDTPAIVAFANSASFVMNTGLYPGGLLTLYGFDLPSSVDDTRVLVNGIPAPILLASPTQINLQVPFGISLSSLPQVQVISPSGSVSAQIPVSQSIGIFTTDGVHAAALNQDGSVNSADNPAPAGSAVSLFGTGAMWPSGMQDGATATSATPLYVGLNNFEAFDWSKNLMNILYVGPAPGAINGVFQMNVQLPPSVPPTAYMTLRSTPPISLGYPPPITSNAWQIYTK